MPSLPNIRGANLSIGGCLPYRPVAVFVGGTSGIGAGMAQAFAHHRNGDAHIILVGRNRAAAEQVLASLPKPAGTDAQHEFVECDVSLMRNVRRTALELSQRLDRINFLVMSPGIMTMQGRTDTEEGIDVKLALHYYARWRFAYELYPLLQRAKDAGQDAKVVSVLSAGVDGGPIDLDDLGLKKGFSLPAAARAVSVYNDHMVQSFAEKYPKLSFIHMAPGVVATPLAKGLAGSHWAGCVLAPLTDGLARMIGVSPVDCGEYMWHGIYSAKAGSANRLDKHGEDIGDKNLWSPPGAKEKVWEHTLEETSK